VDDDELSAGMARYHWDMDFMKHVPR